MLLEGAHAGTIICTDLCNFVDCENCDDMNSQIIIGACSFSKAHL